MSTLKEQRDAAFKDAQALIEKVKAGDEAAIAEFDAKTTEIKSLDERIERGRKGDALVASFEGLSVVDREPVVDAGGAKSPGAWFVKHASTSQDIEVKAPEFKAATDTSVTGGPSGVFEPFLTDVDRNFVRNYRRPLVTDLFGQGTISGQAITYFVEGALEGTATTVAEGAAKPQVHLANPTTRTDALSVIAAWTKITEQVRWDLPFLESEINNNLIYNLQVVEESQVLNGNGSGANIQGLLNRSGIQTLEGAGADVFLQAMADVQNTTGLNADAVVINPADYFSLRTAQDVNGQYYGGGYFTGPYGNGGFQEQPSLWGLRTVVSAAVPVGTAVVGAFKQGATVYRKGGIGIESTKSHASDFTSNLITIRAEERLALAVKYPSAFVNVTIEDAS